jgi:beta-lactamase regulating signal transducer with metallopeptidase domain
MFAVRGIAVSFSVFVLIYCALSVAVSFVWQTIALHLRQYPAPRVADLLFGLRIFPLATAAMITFAFTVPSFLLLEPRTIEEPIGEMPLLLGLVGTVLGVFGIANAALAWRRASQAIAGWTHQAQRVDTCTAVPVLRIVRTTPAMIATGIVRSRVLLSGPAESALNRNELHRALDHEVAHVRRHDNLRKLLFRFVAFPRMSALQAAWLEATEMAADDAAVSSAGDALDLAAALITLSKLDPSETSVDLTAALVDNRAAVVNARVERLIAWTSDSRVPSRNHTPWYGVSAMLATVVLFAATYSQLLIQVHRATEWLVR